ncbi:hypothetical protein NL676_000779 [Syzygium grande]|nr:hypothetical protein NL676_000779 [Syzygium grande]
MALRALLLTSSVKSVAETSTAVKERELPLDAAHKLAGSQSSWSSSSSSHGSAPPAAFSPLNSPAPAAGAPPPPLPLSAELPSRLWCSSGVQCADSLSSLHPFLPLLSGAGAGARARLSLQYAFFAMFGVDDGRTGRGLSSEEAHQL